MNNSPTSAMTGHSAHVSMELSLHSERFSVASMGPTDIVIRNPRRMPPGLATLQLVVDSKTTTFHIRLPAGIEPDRVEQRYELLETVEGAAA